MIAPPRIAFDNLFRLSSAVVTASSEDLPLYPYENAYDWLDTTFWHPNAGAETLTVDLQSAQSANYFAAFGLGDLVDNGATLTLGWATSLAGPYTTVATITPTSTRPHYVNFNATSARFWRVTMTSSPSSRVAILAFGTDLVLPLGDRIGFSPPEWARDTKVMNNVSDGGKFLGRSKIRDGFQTEFKFNFWSPTFITSSWLNFIQNYAENYPFFIKWNVDEYPNSVAYAWCDGIIGKPAFTKAVYTGFTMKIRGEVS